MKAVLIIVLLAFAANVNTQACNGACGVPTGSLASAAINANFPVLTMLGTATSTTVTSPAGT